MNRLIRFCFAAIAAIAAPLASAEPLSFNEAALSRGFALPALGEGTLTPQGRYSQQLDLDVVNEYFLGRNNREELIIDGESTRLAWRLRYGLAPGWELGLVLPYYISGGGFLDATIENWHRWFNLPNANRNLRPRGRIEYRYVRDGNTLLDLRQSSNGIGDLRLQAARALLDGLALRAELKLPTGSHSHLAGNGATGGALWLDATLPFPAGSRFEGFASAGLSYTGRGDVLAEQQRNFVPFGGVGLSARLIGRLGAQAQIGFHGALYKDSSFAPLTHAGAPLWFGLNYRFSDHVRLEALVQEDASVYASPDFVLHLGLALR